MGSAPIVPFTRWRHNGKRGDPTLGELKAEHEAHQRLENERREALSRFGVDAEVLADTVRDSLRACEQPAADQLRVLLAASSQGAQRFAG